MLRSIIVVPCLYIGVWCNGNTHDFDSCVVGSSPATPAMRAKVVPRVVGVRFPLPSGSSPGGLGAKLLLEAGHVGRSVCWNRKPESVKF